MASQILAGVNNSPAPGVIIRGSSRLSCTDSVFFYAMALYAFTSDAAFSLPSAGLSAFGANCFR